MKKIEMCLTDWVYKNGFWRLCRCLIPSQELLHGGCIHLWKWRQQWHSNGASNDCPWYWQRFCIPWQECWELWSVWGSRISEIAPNSTLLIISDEQSKVIYVFDPVWVHLSYITERNQWREIIVLSAKSPRPHFWNENKFA